MAEEEKIFDMEDYDFTKMDKQIKIFVTLINILQ